MTRAFAVATIFILALPALAQADEVSDALQSAQDAYASGDIQYALDELDFARNKLLSMKTDALGAYMPEAPEGWTRVMDEDMNMGMAMLGGGVGARATYTNADQSDTFTITLMADNPMVAGMAAMVSNAAAMGMKVERIGRQRFAVKDGEIIGMIANRIMVQAEGQNTQAMMATLESLDFDALGSFGQ